jgi:hypothetical protein
MHEGHVIATPLQELITAATAACHGGRLPLRPIRGGGAIPRES